LEIVQFNNSPSAAMSSLKSVSFNNLKTTKAIDNRFVTVNKYYPNPISEGLLTIEFSSSIKGAISYQIMNQLGQMLQSKQIENEGNNSLQIDLSELKAGIYFINFNSNNLKNKSIKVLKR